MFRKDISGDKATEKKDGANKGKKLQFLADKRLSGLVGIIMVLIAGLKFFYGK